MMRAPRNGLALALFLFAASSVAPAADLGYEPLPFDPEHGYTQFSIPQTEAPPTADGVVAPGEWDEALVINAQANQHPRPRWGVQYGRWVIWRLLWDADNLYLCAESQRLPGEDLVANYRDETLGGNTVMDDSYEIHFSPVGRNAVGKKLPWSAQSILNPLGVGFYTKFTWSVAARTTGWRPDWTVGNQILDDRWVMELVVPKESLDLAQPNQAGEAWSFLFARNWKRTGWNQSALPGHYTSFGVPQEQTFGYLSSDLYAQLASLEALREGRIELVLTLGSCGAAGGAVKVQARIEEVVKEERGFAWRAKEGGFVWETKDEVPVAAGTQAPWQATDGAALERGKRYRLHLEAQPAAGGPPLLKLNTFIDPGPDEKLEKMAAKLKSVPYKFSAELAPTANKLSVFADFLSADERDGVATLSVTVTPEGGGEALLEASSTNLHHAAIRDTFDLPPLASGTYTWTMVLADGAGKVVAEKSGSFEKLDEARSFPWFSFAGARVDKVLEPYEPIAVENGGARLRYWGGDVYLTGLGLPRQVAVTANREWRPALLEERPSVLAGEVRLVASQGGKAAKVQLQGFPRTTAVADHQARLRGYGRIGEDVEVEGNATFHQDGLLWVDLTLRPARDSSSARDVRRKEATVENLALEIPLEPEVAELLVAHGQPGYASHTIGRLSDLAAEKGVAGEGLVWDCTEIGRSVLTYGNFVAVVWLGDEQRGLAFLVESNEGWVHAGTPDQQIFRRDGAVVLRVNLVQAPLTVTGDHTFRFGFLPSPMRRMEPGWRMLYCGFDQNFRESFGTGRNLAPGQYNSSYMPASYDKSRLLMFRQTQAMATALGGIEFAPHTERGGYETRSNDWAARKYFGPEWSGNTWTPEFQNHLLWHLQRWIDEGGLTGIYHDQFYPAAVPNTISGAAWMLPDGRTNPGYNLRLDRTYNQREHALFQENGIRPRIFCHCTNGGQVVSFPWVTAILDGEDNMVIANADYDFVDIYPPARMQAFGNPWPWGNTFYWMRLIQQGEEQWRARQDRAYVGWTYLHDAFNNNSGAHHKKLWPRLFEWGMNSREVKYWPYWKSRGVLHCSEEKTLVAMWSLPDRVLLCLFNTDRQTLADAVVRVPLVDLGLMPKLRSEYIKARDFESDGRVRFDAWNGTVQAKVLPHDFRLITIRTYRD